MKNSVWIAVIGGLLLLQVGMASEVKGLYEAEVIAQSQQAVDRDNALQAALKQVMARVLAARNLEQDPIAQRALMNVQNYVREYQYSMTEVSQSNPDARLMRVLFDEQKLSALLKNSPSGLWNEIRPETLLWLVVEEQGKRQFFNADKMALLDSALKAASKVQGLPLLYPLMDMQEQSMLSVAEALSPYPHPLLDVSDRYEVVSILVGLVVHRNNCWYNEWAHYFNQGIQQWQGECLPLAQALHIGMQGAYAQLAEYYAVKPDLLALNAAMLKVRGIKNSNDVAAVAAYLKTLNPVVQVNWVSAEPSYHNFQVQFKGQRQALIEALVRSHVLGLIADNDLGQKEILLEWIGMH